MRTATSLLVIALMCTSCYVRIGGSRSSVKYNDEIDFETFIRPVENGLEDGYYPSKFQIISGTEGIIAGYNGENTAIFVTSDGGKNWQKKAQFPNVYCESLQNSRDRAYCHLYSTETLGNQRIMSSEGDYSIWETILEDEHTIKNFKAFGNGVLMAQIPVPETNSTVSGRKYYSVLSKDYGKTWQKTEPYLNLPRTLSYTAEDVIYVPDSTVSEIARFNPVTFQNDTIYNSRELIIEIVGGQDIVGLWEGHRTNFYQISGNQMKFLSSIYDRRHPLRNYTPDELHQYGDTLYTIITPLTYMGKRTTYISTDKAQTWREVNAGKATDEQYNPRVTIYHKDRIVSYCVVEKDGRRQDYIRIIRPKVD